MGNGFARLNGLYLEVLGPGALYSIGYERILLNQELFKTSLQSAAAWYPLENGLMSITIPVSINEILSFNSHHIKIGVGTILILKELNGPVKNTDILAHLRIGYRYQPVTGRFFWEVSLIPFLQGDTSTFGMDVFGSMTAHLWAGMTFGYAFNFRKGV